MLDHLLWGVPDLDEGVRAFAEHGGVRAGGGGRHEGVGTHNALLDLEDDRYLEIIAPDPTQDQFSDFGLLLRGLKTPSLLTWAARTDDIEHVAAAARDAGFAPGEVVDMSRARPDGKTVSWRLLQIGGHPWGPLVPFFIQWLTSYHPCRDAPQGCRLDSFSLTHPEPVALLAALAHLGLEVEAHAAPRPALQAVVESPIQTLILVGPDTDMAKAAEEPAPHD